jgi:hypothetical protein
VTVDEFHRHRRERRQPEAAADTEGHGGGQQDRRGGHLRDGEEAERGGGGELPRLREDDQPSPVDDIRERSGRQGECERGQRARGRDQPHQLANIAPV